jgi:ABC-type lipoprotein release transport system permease subunit
MAVGMGLAFLDAGGIQHILFEVDAHDPLIFAGVAGTLALVGLVTCLIPAVRATLIDPLVAMRAE